jgi:hypothetical protein
MCEEWRKVKASKRRCCMAGYPLAAALLVLRERKRRYQDRLRERGGIARLRERGMAHPPP